MFLDGKVDCKCTSTLGVKHVQDDDEEPDGKYHFAPMGMYVQRDPFDPPRVNFDAIKLDGTFRLMPKEVGLKMTEIYDGTELKYLIENTGKNEVLYGKNIFFLDRTNRSSIRK